MLAKAKISDHLDGSFYTSHFMGIIVEFIHSQVDLYVVCRLFCNISSSKHPLFLCSVLLMFLHGY